MDLRQSYQLLRVAAKREDGQTMAEYGVILALITLAVVATLGVLAVAISGKLGSVTNILGSAL
jgi:Flp pilus assembly pilin Flp